MLTEITEVSDEELDALQSFCTIKISQIHHQLNSKQSNSSKHKDLQHGFTSEKPVTGDLKCTIPDQLVNRIHLKNISETMKQVLNQNINHASLLVGWFWRAAKEKLKLYGPNPAVLTHSKLPLTSL